MTHKKTYTPATVERALIHHGVTWMRRDDGVYVVTTAIGQREMTLRDAYHFCVGLVAKEGLLAKQGVFTTRERVEA